ncbi:MAG: hypothetical protein P9L97_06030 [Candidatus Tenebribacter davisii]|nr:hypothetical protein [Candidatus Tenebribacter davisii]
MADEKLTGIPQLTTPPIAADLIYVVIDIVGTPTSMSTTFANLVLGITLDASAIEITDLADYYVAEDVEGVFAEIGETRSINGYDLTDPDSLPDLAFNNSTLTFSCSVKSGQSSFHFWADDKKIIKTTSQSVVIPDITGTYYIIFDTTGTLIYVNQDAVAQDDFYEHAITGLVYWNKTAQASMVGDERHGILMDPRTHHYNHSTFGSRYESGLNINGLADASPTYTETTSGFFWDEDIRHTLALQSTHPFIYKLGATGEWTGTTPDNKVGFENGTGDVVYNEWTGTTWQLTQSAAATDFMIYFMIATPDILGYNVKKIIGQNGYSTRGNARAAIESELQKLVMEGLPSPEFIFLYAYIVKRNGDLEDMADGSLYLDLRTSKGGVGGSVSGLSSVAADVSIADAGNIITATEVEGALQENRTAIDFNTAKVTNATHTGEVTGSEVLTITDNVIDESNLKLDEAGSNDYILTKDTAKTGGMKWSAPADVSVELGFVNKSNWVDDEQITITLDTPADAITEAHVSVYEEVPQDTLTNNSWDITTGDTGFTLEDTAYAVTLTPGAVTGGSVSFTLGSGSWASTDVSKIIKNVSSGETGEARIISIASGVATCQISIDFTNTDAIASGDWEMVAGEFVNGAFELGFAVDPAVAGGIAAVFESASTYYTSVVMISATKAIVCYQDVGNSSYGTACILDISGSTITPGTPAVFASSIVTTTSVAMLTSTKAIVCYQDDGNLEYGTACILDISGSTITPGTPAVFASSEIFWSSVAMLTSTKAIVCYRDDDTSNYGTACVLDISGSIITPATPVVFDSTYVNSPSVAMLTSTKAIVCYQDVGNSSYGTACILDISGSTITPGTPAVFESASTTYTSVAMLTSTKAIVCYRDNGNLEYGTACILDIVTSTITPGTPVVFESASTYYTSVAMLTSDQAIVCYRDVGNSSYGTACVLDIATSTITPGTPAVFESARSDYVAVTALSYSKVITVYKDLGNSGYGTSVIIDTSSTAYLDNQFIPTISGSDSVDTDLYTDLVSMTTTETLNDQTINYAFSFDPTFIDMELNGGTFIVVGSGETIARNIISSLNSIHGGVEGNWYINTNSVYASETWTAATINNPYAALSQAMETVNNTMSGTATNAVADANWPSFGSYFAASIILHTDDDTVTPSADKISFEYEANAFNVLSHEYEVIMNTVDTVLVTAPSSGGPRNARVYISK